MDDEEIVVCEKPNVYYFSFKSSNRTNRDRLVFVDINTKDVRTKAVCAKHTFLFLGQYEFHVEMLIDMNEGRVRQLAGKWHGNYSVFNIDKEKKFIIEAKSAPVFPGDEYDCKMERDCWILDATSIEYAIARMSPLPFDRLPRRVLEDLRYKYGFLVGLSDERRKKEPEEDVRIGDGTFTRQYYVYDDEEAQLMQVMH